MRLLFLLGGTWQPPFTFDVQANAATSASIDHRLRELVSSLSPVKVPSRERTEHLAFLVRWYFSSWRDGAWIAFDANYYSGGRTTVNGVEQNDELGNSRLGLTFSYPWDRQHSIKLYWSEGISVRYGEDFTVVGAAWQYRWGGGL